MEPFEFYLPTKIIFGKETESRVGEEISTFGGSKVMVVYGQNSVRKSGLLDRVEESLKSHGLDFVFFGGVEPNPKLAKVHEGIQFARQERIDFLLAVGGGSSIDTAKAIAMGVPYKNDVWDIFELLHKPLSCLPVGVILTLPAAGSECSKASVITKEEGNIKKGFNNIILRPRFAILNPELTYSLPAYQTASGCVDIMMHTMERYFSKCDENSLSDRLAESLLLNVIEYAPIALKEPTDYKARSEIMWSGSISHTDLTGLGMPTDWATHQIEHELSSEFNAVHGAGLAALWGSWARYVYKEGLSRFVRFGRTVWGIQELNPNRAALMAIEKTEQFFRLINMPTNIPELIGRKLTDNEISSLAYRCTFFGKRTIGNLIVMEQVDIEAVYRMANS